MGWEDNQLTRTLLIQRTGSDPNATYRLHPYFRVTTREGQTYMSPLPSGDISLAHQGLIFQRVEFIEPPGSGQYGGGDTFLTRDTNDSAIRLTANN